MKDDKCLLEEPNCDRRCTHCGWRSVEAERRDKAIKENGLTICADGLERLIIKRGE